MATHTAVSDHSTLADQQVKEEVQDELKLTSEKPSESLASEEVKKVDVVDAETEEKIEDKKIEPLVTDEEAKLVAEEEIPMSFPAVEEKAEEKQFEKEVAFVEAKESVNLGTLLKEDAIIKEEPILTETLVEVTKGDENEEKSTLTDPIFAPEKSLDVESISNIKEQVLAAVETDGDELVTKELVEKEAKKTEAEEKGEENLITEENKETEDLPNEEVKEMSLLSKVKSSLFKAKKAIIGKSPNPKATEIPLDIKGEVNA